MKRRAPSASPAASPPLCVQLPARFAYALSGGLDSVTLLHALHSAGHRPLVLHYNHRWHPRETACATWCQKLCLKLDLPFLLGQSSGKKTAPSSEDAARRERYDFLFHSATQNGHCLVTAHTASDQAETVLLALLRGAGSRGLSGMRPDSSRSGIRLLRPWLTTSRKEILLYATAHRLKWREDPFNSDLSYARVRIRSRLLPYLEKLSPGATPSLLRAAALLADEDAFLEDLASAELQKLRDKTDPARLFLPGLQSLHPALLRRILKLWLQSQAVPDLSFADIEALRTLLIPDTAPAVNLAQNYHVRRREKRLLLEPPTRNLPRSKKSPPA